MLMEKPKWGDILYAKGLKLKLNADQFNNYIMAGRTSFSAIER